MKETREERLKALIKEAEAAKKRGESLSDVFARVAAETGMAKGSVRNAYYGGLKRAQRDRAYSEKIGGDRVKVGKIEEFKAAEARALLKKILVGATTGKSVRGVIGEMTGDGKIALRYQNKYRNMIKYDKKTVEEVVKEITAERGKCYNPYEDSRKDALLSKLKSEINGLYARICEHTRKENEELKAKLRFYRAENERLRLALEKRDEKKLSVKDYFENRGRRDVKPLTKFYRR